MTDINLLLISYKSNTNYSDFFTSPELKIQKQNVREL